MQIPIQNLYYMLCYAWNTLQEGEIVSLNGIDSAPYFNLFARVLCSGTNHALKRGLYRDYRNETEELRTIRGKLNISQTLKANKLGSGKVVCEHDELTANTLPNQIIKTTLLALLHTDGLAKLLNEEISQVLRRMTGIDTTDITNRTFNNLVFPQTNHFYRFLLRVCELVYSQLLPEEEPGHFKFRDFIRDEKKMGSVFESFVRNFYKLEQEHFSVGAENITWDANPLSEGGAEVLPLMKTDVSLSRPDRKVVIETKFYSGPFETGHFGKETLRSRHLYQLASYLQNIENQTGSKPEGILLYPSMSESQSYEYEIWGKKLSVRAINLNRPWQEIHSELLGLIAA